MSAPAAPEAPRRIAPAGSCDCHMHIYDGRPVAVPGAAAPPPHSGVADYRAVQAELGLERVVVVQANAYGFDNGAMLDALAAFGPAAARGVAVVAPDVDDAALADLHARGVRGVRFHMLPGGTLQWPQLDAVVARIAPFGWHAQLQLNGCELAQHLDRLRALPVDCVVDHVGRFVDPGPPGVDDPAFVALQRLLDGGRCWVKLSAPYESSRRGPPGYADVAALARALVASHPQRCVWASNWPHPGHVPQPSAAAMLDLLLDWAEDAATRRRILVDNPAALYGFDADAAAPRPAAP